MKIGCLLIWNESKFVNPNQMKSIINDLWLYLFQKVSDFRQMVQTSAGARDNFSFWLRNDCNGKEEDPDKRHSAVPVDIHCHILRLASDVSTDENLSFALDLLFLFRIGFVYRFMRCWGLRCCRLKIWLKFWDERRESNSNAFASKSRK
jgi:hypothetical protein